MSALLEMLGAWPVAASVVLAASLRTLRSGRRRRALNESLHELRRPLQTIALSGADRHGSVHLAAAALERLDRQINGGRPASRRDTVDVRPLLVAAVGRLLPRARAVGASLILRQKALEACVPAEPVALAQAIDNLIVNAIEHGGREIQVASESTEGFVRIVVIDSGRVPRVPARSNRVVGLASGLTGRRRRGHGLNVVRRVAAAHEGRFEMRARRDGVEAILELPLAAPTHLRAA
ncbi:MAG TPA: ATP-binding protein [Solirubrobacterales bacterium]|jgi:signal transduction histidine kinase